MQINLKRNDLETINIDEFGIDLPELKNIVESKALVIGKWLECRIKTDLANNKIAINNLLPTKREFAYLLGVSVGTMQNAFRYLEDVGLDESKQCIGTMIKDLEKTSVRKLTSKREIAIESVKKYILDKKMVNCSPESGLQVPFRCRCRLPWCPCHGRSCIRFCHCVSASAC